MGLPHALCPYDGREHQEEDARRLRMGQHPERGGQGRGLSPLALYYIYLILSYLILDIAYRVVLRNNSIVVRTYNPIILTFVIKLVFKD